MIPARLALASFLASESGAVTVDWVVLTAAITGLGLASAAAVRSGTAALGSDIEASLVGASVVAQGELGQGQGGGAGWAYAWRYATDADFPDWWEEIASYDDEMLLSQYQWYADSVQVWVIDANHESPSVMDWTAALGIAIADRNLPLPEGSPSVQDLNAAYAAAFD